MRERNRLGKWLFLIAAAAVIHLLVLVYVKPSFFYFLKRTPRVSSHTHRGGPPSPDAILYIPVEIEDEGEEHSTLLVTEDAEVEDVVEPSDRSALPTTRADSSFLFDLGDIAGDASQTRAQGPDEEPVRVPPRPVQITWPDTRELSHCVGHQVNVRIQVAEDGRILAVEADATDHPPDCVKAAVQSAEQIVFEPGSINGRPVKMWTQIRIDFRKKD